MASLRLFAAVVVAIFIGVQSIRLRSKHRGFKSNIAQRSQILEEFLNRSIALESNMVYNSAGLDTGLWDGEMKVIDPPERDSFKNWRHPKGPSTLYSFTTADTENDPCKTECSVCPASESAGFDPASLGIGDWPCLCHADYRKYVKAGDYKVPFTHEDVPYEFLIAGAAGQSVSVRFAVNFYLLLCIRLVRVSQSARYDWGSDEEHTSNSEEAILMGSNRERAATLEYVQKIAQKIPWNQGLPDQVWALYHLGLSIDFIFSCLYKLLPKVYAVFNKLSKADWTTRRHAMPFPEEIFDLVDERFYLLKKGYMHFFCQEDQGREGPCDFHNGVQMEKYLHEEHDFSQPFDGWFEWRFISKKDGSSPPQKGPFTPEFKESLPLVDRAQTTLKVFDAIGLPFGERYGERQKLEELLKAQHGSSWDNESATLPIGSGITWWEQFDCDCSPATCQPPASEQVCEGGFNRVAGRVGGRSVAGPSGTSQKMMQVARLLKMNAQSLYMLRLGLVAWMVPSEDHSLLEILMGCEGTGLPYPHDSRIYSLSALLPGEELTGVREDVLLHLEGLHNQFNLRFGVEEGPRALCKGDIKHIIQHTKKDDQDSILAEALAEASNE